MPFSPAHVAQSNNIPRPVIVLVAISEPPLLVIRDESSRGLIRHTLDSYPVICIGTKCHLVSRRCNIEAKTVKGSVANRPNGSHLEY